MADERELQVYRSGGSSEPLPTEITLPTSVGFAITQMIDRGLLDDCLQLIKARAAARQAIIAKEQIRKPPRPEGVNAKGPIPKRFRGFQ